MRRIKEKRKTVFVEAEPSRAVRHTAYAAAMKELHAQWAAKNSALLEKEQRRLMKTWKEE